MEVTIEQVGDLACSHKWEYFRGYDDDVDRRCGLCHRREGASEREALDDDEWREFILPLVDPRAE